MSGKVSVYHGVKLLEEFEYSIPGPDEFDILEYYKLLIDNPLPPKITYYGSTETISVLSPTYYVFENNNLFDYYGSAKCKCLNCQPKSHNKKKSKSKSNENEDINKLINDFNILDSHNSMQNTMKEVDDFGIFLCKFIGLKKKTVIPDPIVREKCNHVLGFISGKNSSLGVLSVICNADKEKLCENVNCERGRYFCSSHVIPRVNLYKRDKDKLFKKTVELCWHCCVVIGNKLRQSKLKDFQISKDFINHSVSIRDIIHQTVLTQAGLSRPIRLNKRINILSSENYVRNMVPSEEITNLDDFS